MSDNSLEHQRIDRAIEEYEKEIVIIQAHIDGKEIGYHFSGGKGSKYPYIVEDAHLFNFKEFEYYIIVKTGKERLVEDITKLIESGFLAESRVIIDSIIKGIKSGHYGDLNDV